MTPSPTGTLSRAALALRLATGQGVLGLRDFRHNGVQFVRYAILEVILFKTKTPRRAGFRRVLPPRECIIRCGETIYPDSSTRNPQLWCSKTCNTNYRDFKRQKNFIPLLPEEE